MAWAKQAFIRTRPSQHDGRALTAVVVYRSFAAFATNTFVLARVVLRAGVVFSAPLSTSSLWSLFFFCGTLANGGESIRVATLTFGRARANRFLPGPTTVVRH